MTSAATEVLLSGELVVIGRVMSASNATLLAEVDGTRVAYKPVSGERPLWDFPDGTLAGREVASHLVSRAAGWDIVPPTVLRDGPHGIGSVQLWCEPDPGQAAVDLLPAGRVPDDVAHVLDGLDGRERPVALVHERTAELRRMSLFDVIVNNADRKGGHVLAMGDGRRLGIDHGLTFHCEDKLRTVLWGWAGEELTEDEIAVLSRLEVAFQGALGEELLEHLQTEEIEATIRRCRSLGERGRFPFPSDRWPAIPWPPF
ncbi:SCO1664 family protein [Nocardioides gilvus]|uniref:SCO1664 family protein n=1 Tax=Nocardioides gilvus TaxID=1735589 RepID=UPI000D746EE8|nr:SCO1664 family protein [Nocardioides gilvus]